MLLTMHTNTTVPAAATAITVTAADPAAATITT
jgi:hypothetical protein